MAAKISGINPTGRDNWLRTSTVRVRIPYTRPLRYVQQSINVFASEARIEGLIPSPATILSRVGEMISRVINKKMYLALKILI